MPCQSGCVRLQGEILNHWPNETYNAGCFNPLSRTDSGSPSPHAKGEAIDIGIKQQYRGRGSVGQQIFLWLHANRARLGIVQLIWCQQIWSATHSPGSIRSYTVNPHFDHIHCQLNPQAARSGSGVGGSWGGAPKPGVKKPDPTFVEEEVFRVIKGDKNATLWLTNWLEKRKIDKVEEANAIVKAGVTNGAPTVTWPQAFVDNIPVREKNV